MAYDPTANRVVMFGGELPGGWILSLDGATWTYDADTNSWEFLPQSVAPDPRVGHSLVSTGRLGRVVLFGGTDFQHERNDTWVFDVNTRSWTNVTTSGAPEPRTGQAMYWSELRQRIVLIGGSAVDRSPTGWKYRYFSDTWSYDLTSNRWEPLNVTGSFPSFDSSTTAFDTDNQRLLLFGWPDKNATEGRIWSLDLLDLTWRDTGKTTDPVGAKGFGATYDPSVRRVVVHGGYIPKKGTYGASKLTWLLDPSKLDWAPSTSPSAPSVYQGFANAYDTGSRRLVLFGGSSGYWSDETWTYEGSSDRWTERTDAKRWEWFSFLLLAILFSSSAVSAMVLRFRRAGRVSGDQQPNQKRPLWKLGARTENTGAFAVSTGSVLALSGLASMGSDSIAGLPLALCCPILLLLLLVVGIGAREREGNELSNWSAGAYTAIGYTNGGLASVLAGLAITFAPRASVLFYSLVALATIPGLIASLLVASSASRRQTEPSPSALGAGALLLIMAGGLLMTLLAFGTSGSDGYCPACGLLYTAIPLALAALSLLPGILISSLAIRKTGPAKPILALASVLIATTLVGASILSILDPRFIGPFPFILSTAALAAIYCHSVLTARAERESMGPPLTDRRDTSTPTGTGESALRRVRIT